MNTTRVAWLAAIAVFFVHVIGNAHYGFFRDELYFIVCGMHPQWGYVDQPPVVPLLAAFTQLGGHSLFLLRLVPALFAAAGAYTTVLLVAEFGGALFAQSLASIVFLFTWVLLAFGAKAGPDEVGLWTWPMIAYLLVRLSRGANPRLWLALGAITGLSIQSKYSVLFFLVAMLAGLLATPQRRMLFDRWCAAGAGLALLIALPNFLWQAHHDFPMWQLLEAGQHGKNIIVGPLVYLLQEIVITNFFLFPVWVIGVIWLLRRPDLRFLGYAYIVLILEMMILHGKHYYPADIYPITIAAGAVAIEAWTANLRAVRIALIAYAVLTGPVFLPFSLPVLPEASYVAYQSAVISALHFPKGFLATEHGREASALPGDYADMHGWPQLAAVVARVYDALPPNERAAAVVFGDNYGEAAAVQVFAPGIPVISSHNQYWLWGPGTYDGRVLVQINGTCWAKEGYFRSRRVAAIVRTPWTIGWETGIPINICRGLKVPVKKLWTEAKMYE